MPEVKSGQAIKASDINEIARMAAGMGTIVPGKYSIAASGVVVSAKNVSSVDLAPGFGAHISGVVPSVGTSPSNERTITLEVGGNNTGALCIALESIPTGRFGKVLIQGAAWGVYEGEGDKADIEDVAGFFTLSDTGAAPVLYADPSNNMALILIGGGSGGGEAGAVGWYFTPGP